MPANLFVSFQVGSCLITLIGLLISLTTQGQIVNSLSGDKSGMYYFAVDTVLKRLNQERSFDRIAIKADRQIIQNFPDSIQGKKIVKLFSNQQSKKQKIVVGDVVLQVGGLSIIRNQITILISTYEKTKGGMPFFAEGAYLLYFKYLPEKDVYTLTKITSGLRL